MIMNQKICIIVPAYNEEKNIKKVIDSLYEANPNWGVVVINDGSVDSTVKVARSTKKATVVDLPCNLGIGGGVQTGFKFAVQNDFDIAIQFDGDGQHVATEIPKLIAPILNGEADVVIGSRFIESQEDNFQSTALRRVGIKIFEWLNAFLIKQKITDNTSGFRAYNKEAFSLLAKYYPVDYPEPEAVILLGKNKYKIIEIPVFMKEREGGVSSIGGLKSAYYMIKVILAVLLASARKEIPEFVKKGSE